MRPFNTIRKFNLFSMLVMAALLLTCQLARANDTPPPGMVDTGSTVDIATTTTFNHHSMTVLGMEIGLMGKVGDWNRDAWIRLSTGIFLTKSYSSTWGGIPAPVNRFQMGPTVWRTNLGMHFLLEGPDIGKGQYVTGSDGISYYLHPRERYLNWIIGFIDLQIYGDQIELVVPFGVAIESDGFDVWFTAGPGMQMGSVPAGESMILGGQELFGPGPIFSLTPVTVSFRVVRKQPVFKRTEPKVKKRRRKPAPPPANKPTTEPAPSESDGEGLQEGERYVQK